MYDILYKDGYLCHHGIMGQKWGVRRWQYSDGSLTPDGRIHYGVGSEREYKLSSGNADDSNSIYKSLSRKERVYVTARDNPAKQYTNQDEYNTLLEKNYTIKKKGEPVSTFDIWRENDNDVALALMTKRGDQYRGKGYANKVTKKAIAYLERSGKDNAYWDVNKDNAGSRHLAEKYGFVNEGEFKEGWLQYRRKFYHPNDSVFVSGKIKYDKPLNRDMRREMDDLMKQGSKVIIGDAPGADTRVQDYMAKKGYKNVVVYTTDPKVRNNVGNWEVKRISGKGYKDEAAVRRQKDIAMTKDASRAFAIMPEDDRPDSAMSKNVSRLSKENKYTKIYDYNKHKWIIK